MKQNKFKVVISKKNLIAFFILFFVIEIGLIVMIFNSEFVLLSIVLAIGLLAIGLVAVMSTLLFYVEVNESTLKVRTRLGKQYKFNCSEIEEVACSKNISARYGPSFYITLFLKSEELQLEGTMIGFKEMARYILEQYEKGVIKHTAVSENCKRILRQYKNGDIFKKKQ